MKGRQIVLGTGISSAALVKIWCENQEKFGNTLDTVEIWDEAESAPVMQALSQRYPNIQVRLGAFQSHEMNYNDKFYISPGISPQHPFVSGLDPGMISSEIEYGFEILNEIQSSKTPILVIGITGTNGKTTTTLMVKALGEALGLESYALGNIGNPFSEVIWKISKLERSTKEPILIALELSSAQLHYLNRARLQGAIITNIEPDHLKWHGSFEAYRAAKLKIRKFIESRQPVVDLSRAEGIYGSLDFSSFRLFGAHNRMNFAMAVLAVKEALQTYPLITHEKINDAISKVMAGFLAPPHRLELCGSKNGTVFINDSKATNVASVKVALRAVEYKRINLLLGGRMKGDDFRELNPYLKNTGTTVSIFAFGESRNDILKQLESISTEIKAFVTLDEAFEAAVVDASDNKHLGEVDLHRSDVSARTAVLLSPGCASFDAYRNFEARGEAFKQLVRKKCGRDAV